MSMPLRFSDEYTWGVVLDDYTGPTGEYTGLTDEYIGRPVYSSENVRQMSTFWAYSSRGIIESAASRECRNAASAAVFLCLPCEPLR
jgi:hypothetical protein